MSQPTPQFNNKFSVQLQFNYGAIFFLTFIVVRYHQKIKKDITDGTLDNQLNPEFTIENNSSIIGSVIGDDNEDDDDEDLNFDSLTNLNLNNIPVRFNFNADGRADITNFNSSPGDLIQLSENFNDYDLFPTPVTPLPNGLAGTGITNEIISFVENVTSMSLSNLNQSSFV